VHDKIQLKWWRRSERLLVLLHLLKMAGLKIIGAAALSLISKSINRNLWLAPCRDQFRPVTPKLCGKEKEKPGLTKAAAD